MSRRSPPRVRRRPPRTLPIAQLARWPRPVGVVLLATVALLVATVWRPALALAVTLWALAAAAAVLDGRLRGVTGNIAGLWTALTGPLGGALVALARRRAVRKVTGWYRGGLPVALVAALAGGALATVAGRWALDRLAYTVAVPSAAMAPRIAAGDRVVVSPILLRTPTRGEIVGVAPFDRARPFGAEGRVFTVLRVVGLPGDWVGATGRGFYHCRRPPDIARRITPDRGCVFPDERGYTLHRTRPFGPVPVPAGTVFVLADDRAVPGDSREFGPVPDDAVAGRVVATLWPLERLSAR